MAIHKFFILILCTSSLTSLLDAFSNNSVFSGMEASGNAIKSFANSILDIKERAALMKKDSKEDNETKDNRNKNNKKQRSKKQVNLSNPKQPKTIVSKNKNNSPYQQRYNNYQKHSQQNSSTKQQKNNYRKDNRQNIINNNITNNKQNKQATKQISVKNNANRKTIVCKNRKRK